MGMKYVRVCKGQNTKGNLVPLDSVNDHIDASDSSDYYVSLFQYNQQHFEQFKEKGTVAGITDVTTNTLYFDFDSENDVPKAKADAIELIARLSSYGISCSLLNIYFSGQKGFSIEIETNSEFTPADLKRICKNLGQGLETLDTQIYNASRIVRVPFTRHNKSGLYKIPLTAAELSEKTVETIKYFAETGDSTVMELAPVMTLPESILALEEVESEKPLFSAEEAMDLSDLDFSKRPKGMSECRYALLHGFFKPGQRSKALMILAAYYRAGGLPKEVTYRILKGARELNERRYPSSVDSDTNNKDYLWNNIIGQVYGGNWKGAVYTCKDEPVLREVCKAIGSTRCSISTKKEEPKLIVEHDAYFRQFAANIEKNRILTGIEPLDKHLFMTTAMSVGLLGAPSSGKTSLALNILNNASLANIPSVFFSFDMGVPLVYAKLISKHTGMSYEKVLKMFRDNPIEAAKASQVVKENYSNSYMDFRSGQTVQDLDVSIASLQDKNGHKIKLVVVDYLELVTSGYSDPTVGSGMVANQLKDLANKHELCVITLVQPQKSAGDASSPLTSMRQIKGASVIEQAFSVILGVYREGFSPQNPENDKYMSIVALKNRMGGLFSIDLSWDGRTGTVNKLTADEDFKLNNLRADKAENKKDANNWD
jgi:KaiC/GvpD/RAD55 family RecA-like ATPase